VTGAVLGGAASTVGAATPSGVARVNGNVSGVITGAGACTTSAAVVTALGSYTLDTYAWTQVSGDTDRWTINSPTSASTTFTCSGLNNGDIEQAVFQIVATDTGPPASATLQVTATARSTSTL
jgi:hypothetical protein